MTRRIDLGGGGVVIVGAGISGLTTANALRENGIRAVVVEANDRVGGRTWTVEEDGGPLDRGGMFIGLRHDESMALGKSLGLEMVPAYTEGDMIYVLPDGTYRAEDTVLGDAWGKSAQLYAAFDLLDEVSSDVGAEAPWECPRAEELDRVNVATWVEDNVADPDVRALVEMEVNSVVGADSTEVSMLYWAWYVAACEGVRSIRFDVNDSLWIGGSQQISELLAAALGDDLLLNWPVTGVRHDDDGVTVYSPQGEIRAGNVVVAVPPHSSHRILFEPMLSVQRMQFQMRAPMGRMAKVQVRYAEPFWRADGLSGEYCSTVGISCIGMDVVRPDDSMATLVSFIGGREYDTFTALAPEQRKAAFIDLMVDVYGEGARSPLFYHEMLWPQQPWQLGAPTSFVPPGAFASTAAARQSPVGRIHFAGTEAAARYPGFMEGAVRAGNAAARALTDILHR